MELLGKYSVFVCAAIILNMLDRYVEGSFVDTFLGDDVVEYVWTFIAIHAAGGVVLAGNIKLIEERTGHDFSQTFVALRGSSYEVFILFGACFFLRILHSGSKKILEWHHYEDAVRVMLLVVAFAVCYAIYDLVKATYSTFVCKV